jgi:alpha-glucosidase (family GH31 glycosyl hydrolase)
MHYLYTAFYSANMEGTPIMRPMWMEFPSDTNTFALGNQFMFGGDMLVAPKLGEPISFSSVMNGIYNISVYLPPASDWYFYNNKEMISGSSTTQHVVVGDDEFGTFVRAGAILPILNYEAGRMSILHAINDPLRIEVYPDST